jgi:hypothetical protein
MDDSLLVACSWWFGTMDRGRWTIAGGHLTNDECSMIDVESTGAEYGLLTTDYFFFVLLFSFGSAVP